MRVILYTGKGGVGKTTVAAATAVKCASMGYKTLVISTDAAHSLGDSIDQEIGDQPTKLAPNLWGQEVNALHELEEHWDRIHIYLTSLFASQGVDDIVAEEMASPPGMEEVASLMWIKKHKREGKFDVLIVDCAPTGETLQLLAFPDVAKWYLDRIFPIHRMMNKVARPVMQPFISIPLPSDEIFSNVKDLLIDLEGMKKILGDPKVCTTRIVLNLEKMVVKEAQRAFTYLSLYDYLTDLVVVNRVLPPEVTDRYFELLARGAAALLGDGRHGVLTNSDVADKAVRPRDRRARTRLPRWRNRSTVTATRRRSSTTPSRNASARSARTTSCSCTCPLWARMTSISSIAKASSSSASGRTSARSRSPVCSTASGLPRGASRRAYCR